MSGTDEQVIREHLGSLRDETADLPEWEWSSPIGDGHCAAWNWAGDLERRFGVDRQEALRIAFAEVRP